MAAGVDPALRIPLRIPRRIPAALLVVGAVLVWFRPAFAEDRDPLEPAGTEHTVAERIAAQEAVTAFSILEASMQNSYFPLETRYRAGAIGGGAAALGAVVAGTWIGLLPAIGNWNGADVGPSDFEPRLHGLLTGFAAGGAGQLLAVAIAHTAYPYTDMRAAYSSVLDVVEESDREEAARSLLIRIKRRAVRRRILGGVLSFAAVSAPVAAYLGINHGLGNLDQHTESAIGFAGGAGLALLFSLYYLTGFDQQAALYDQYARALGVSHPWREVRGELRKEERGR